MSSSGRIVAEHAKVSGKNRNTCPDVSGISVRMLPEYSQKRWSTCTRICTVLIQHAEQIERNGILITYLNVIKCQPSIVQSFDLRFILSPPAYLYHNLTIN